MVAEGELDVHERKIGRESTLKQTRIADQLRRAFDGSAWHGPALLELLKDVDAATAAARPLPNVHSIWELVLHIAVWDGSGSASVAWREVSAYRWQEFSAHAQADRGSVAAGCCRDETHSRHTRSDRRGSAGCSGCTTAFPESDTTFITCCTASRSMSCIMQGRLRF